MQENNKQKSLQVQTHYNNLINQNYTEEPVDILKFLSDPQYLGISTGNGADIFPKWKEALVEMFDDNTKLIVVLTGSIGTGKSTIALYALCYIQYRLMILREPWRFFGLANSGKMSISFFNLSKNLGGSRGFNKMMDFMSKSPWFRKRSTRITPTKNGDQLDFALIKYVLASPYAKGFGIVGEDVVAGIMDEVDSPMDPLPQKARVTETYEATVLRFKSRFATTGYSLGKLFVVCSKQDEMSFIDTFIAERSNDKEVLIFDVPYWEAKPKHLFCGDTFPIAIGDAYNPSRIIEEHEIPNYVQNGFRIIRPPVEFKKEFILNLVGSLRDIAGVTTAGAKKFKLFPADKFIIDCFDKTKEDPCSTPIIRTGLNDEIGLIKYLDLSKLRIEKHVPRYIHYDISFSGDASGLSMCGVKDWEQAQIQNPDGTYRTEMVPIIETDFSLRIKAFDGDRIPLHKIRKLVLDLKQSGYNIHKFTADLQLASEDTLQLLSAAGITTDSLSMDKNNKGYFDFRNVVFEKRWKCHWSDMLLTELRYLEQSPLDGKVDHPKEVLETEILEDGTVKETKIQGSKDLSDATAGAVVSCLWSNERPMDTTLMSNMLKKTSINNNPQSTTILQEEMTKLLPLKDSQGKTIIGTKQGDQVEKINDIFRRLHSR